MSNPELLPDWVATHQLSTIPGSGDDDASYDAAHVDTENMDEADIILSFDPKSGMHRPVLDIDFGAALIPSSTPGNFHLYLDKPMTGSAYMRLLHALDEAGIIEHGYASVSDARGYTAVRLPWVKKSEPTA